jgi:hypothetical protein
VLIGVTSNEKRRLKKVQESKFGQPKKRVTG